MSEEKVYTFSKYVLGYDSGRDNDRSCLTISKILNDNIYVMSTLYDESAEVISIMLDSLQQKIEQLENIRKEAIEYITTEQLYTNYQWGKSQYVKILKDLLNILNKGE